ncbi:MAG TPA: TIGR03621 family F420-dependent LLM class oxidoreductase [Dehalococcoidia bacterium]|nr:TIGR03621 family F420-dependent LLM class oxidoreductase [Dehalococcoidia bacterium]
MPTHRKIRFGFAAVLPNTVAEWRDLGRKAEDLGYDVMHVADHLSRQWSPLLALLSVADATTRLRVGTQVIANDFRHPVVLAKEIATLDVLTGGRFECGIGVGHPATSAIGRTDYAQLGRPMDEPGPRVGRLAESLRLIKQFLGSSEPFDFAGSFYNGTGILPFPRAVQQPRPPIMVAGAGPRMLRLSGREADIINIAPRPPTVGPSARGTVGFGLDIHGELELIKEAAGARYDDIELCVFADRAVVTADVEPAMLRLQEELQINRQQLLEMPHTLIGEPAAIEERILADRERYGITYRIVPGALMEAFAPVVKRLAGA